VAIKSTAVTVATTATRLDTATETDSEGHAIYGQSIAVYNNGAATIYLGGSDVTTSNGVPVTAGTWGPSFDIPTRDEALYGRVASGTVEARVIEIGV
jgi:hypothetical protein